MKLEKIKNQELSKWWDVVTLKKYLENKKIPRGLRILTFPNFDDLDSDLLQEWEDNLFNSSATMMNILIKHVERKSDKLRDEKRKFGN